MVANHHGARVVGGLSFFGSIPVCVPSAAFEREGTLGDDFSGFSAAFRAFNAFGSNADKFFYNRTIVGALELIYRHRFFSCLSRAALSTIGRKTALAIVVCHCASDYTLLPGFVKNGFWCRLTGTFAFLDTVAPSPYAFFRHTGADFVCPHNIFLCRPFLFFR